MKRIAFLMVLIVISAGLASSEIFDDKSLSPGPSNVGLMPDAAGGPDDFGYIFSDNAEPACTDLYAFVDISTTGTAAGLAGQDDDYAGPFPFGFSFDFYGTAQTEFYVGSNGVIYFFDDYLGLGNTCPLPDYQGYSDIDTFIALYHDDLIIQADGEVYYENFAACPVGNGGQCTIVQFYNARAYGGSDSDNMNFEAAFYDNGTVVFLYAQPSNSDAGQNNGGSATIGIQGLPDPTPVWAIEYSCDTPSLASGLAIAFAPPGAATSGVPDVCGQVATPTPAGPQPIPTNSNAGFIVLVLMLVVAAFVIISRRTA